MTKEELDALQALAQEARITANGWYEDGSPGPWLAMREQSDAIDSLIARIRDLERRADTSTIAQVKDTAIPLNPAGDKERDEWVNAKDRLPDCDEDAIYIGINGAGFVGAFTSITQTPSKINNGYMYINCYYDTAEENVHVMNGLKLWRKMDLPRGIELGWKEGGES